MLEVALRVFAERGYRGASMDEIAEGVGVTKPMLYLYFGSKEALYEASIQAEGRAFRSELAQAVEGLESAEERLWAGIDACFRFVENHPSVTRIYQQELFGGGPLNAGVVAIRGQVIERVAALLARTAEEQGLSERRVAQAEWTACALVGAAESLADRWLNRREGTREQAALLLMNLVYVGLEDLLEGKIWRPAGTGAPAG